MQTTCSIYNEYSINSIYSKYIYTIEKSYVHDDFHPCSRYIPPDLSILVY